MEHVWYEAGNEHNPSDPFGRITLELGGDGSVRLDHHGWDGHRAWTARVDATLVQKLERALRSAGFPSAEMIMPVPGDRMRVLRVSGALAGEVLLPWYDALKLAGYDEAFELLDGLVAAVTGLDIRVSPLDPAPTDVRQVR